MLFLIAAVTIAASAPQAHTQTFTQRSVCSGERCTVSIQTDAPIIISKVQKGRSPYTFVLAAGGFFTTDYEASAPPEIVVVANKVATTLTLAHE